jgi:hypothetical protein
MSSTKISLKNKFAQQSEEDSSNEEDEEDEKKEEIFAKFKFSEVEQSWMSSSVLWTPSTIQQILPNAEGNEARCSEKQYKRGTHNKKKFIFKHSLNNTNHVGYLKSVLRLMLKLNIFTFYNE